MNYRCMTSVIGIYDLISSMFLLVVILCMGLSVLENWISLNMRYIIAIPLMLFAVVMYSCYLSVLSDWRLIGATYEGIEAQAAIDKCRLWLILSWISFGARLVAVILISCRGFTILYYNYKNRLKTRRYFSDEWEGFFNLYVGGILFAFALLRGSSLFCVIKFKRELKQVLTVTEITNSANRMTESTILCSTPDRRISYHQNISASTIINFNPITISQANATTFLPLCSIRNCRATNSIDDLPSYEAVAFGNTDIVAPPSYDSLSVLKNDANIINPC